MTLHIYIYKALVMDVMIVTFEVFYYIFFIKYDLKLSLFMYTLLVFSYILFYIISLYSCSIFYK
jgi:hypothetical protein